MKKSIQTQNTMATQEINYEEESKDDDSLHDLEDLPPPPPLLVRQVAVHRINLISNPQEGTITLPPLTHQLTLPNPEIAAILGQAPIVSTDIDESMWGEAYVPPTRARPYRPRRNAIVMYDGPFMNDEEEKNNE